MSPGPEPQGAGFPDRGAELAALVGSPTGSAELSPHAVNAPMIRHWVEAMGDEDPVYVSDAAARAEGFPGVVAPPTMLQAWIMRGLRASLAVEVARAEVRPAGTSVTERMMALLDEEGMTSVVATNCEQTYARPLVIGDRLIFTSVLESISDVKTTGLGTGRFVTTRLDYLAVADESVGPDADPGKLAAVGEQVATMRFRILKFRPKTAPTADEGGSEPAPAPKRPRPAITQDIAFWFEGAREHKLLIQHCTDCGELRHPPLPACPSCRSFEWDAVESSGRGQVYSYVVVHYPQVPAFDYPLAIGLIELEEGTRLVADLEGIDPSLWQIGMAVTARFVDHDDELSLPVFRPAGDPSGAQGS